MWRGGGGVIGTMPEIWQFPGNIVLAVNQPANEVVGEGVVGTMPDMPTTGDLRPTTTS